MTAEMEAMLAKEMDNNVYAHLWVTSFGNTIWLNTDYYTVRNNVVYLITKGGELRASGDSLLDTKTQCVEVGVFVQDQYNSSSKEMTAKRAIKIFK